MNTDNNKDAQIEEMREVYRSTEEGADLGAPGSSEVQDSNDMKAAGSAFHPHNDAHAL